MIRLFDHNIWCNKVIANRNALIKKMISRYDADVCTLQECRPSTHRVGETDIGAMLGITSTMIPGIAIGVVGMIMALVNYPIYKGILNARKKKYGAEILKLSEKIMND